MFDAIEAAGDGYAGPGGGIRSADAGSRIIPFKRRKAGTFFSLEYFVISVYGYHKSASDNTGRRDCAKGLGLLARNDSILKHSFDSGFSKFFLAADRYQESIEDSWAPDGSNEGLCV